MPKKITFGEDVKKGRAINQVYFSELFHIIYEPLAINVKQHIAGEVKTVLMDALFHNQRSSSSYHKRETVFSDCSEDRRATPEETKVFREAQTKYRESQANISIPESETEKTLEELV